MSGVSHQSHHPQRARGARIWGWTWAQVLRLLAATWHKHHEGLDILDRLAQGRDPHIVAFWHRKFVTLFPLLEGRSVCVVTAATRTGDVIADMCDRFGYSKVQIPKGGGDGAIRLMEEAMTKFEEGSIAVDGPNGPYHAVKRGAIQVASNLGYLVVPVSVASRRKVVLSHRWDRLEIPSVFTRVSLVIGEPLAVPRQLSPHELPEWAQRLHDVLEDLDARAELVAQRR